MKILARFHLVDTIYTPRRFSFLPKRKTRIVIHTFEKEVTFSSLPREGNYYTFKFKKWVCDESVEFFKQCRRVDEVVDQIPVVEFRIMVDELPIAYAIEGPKEKYKADLCKLFTHNDWKETTPTQE